MTDREVCRGEIEARVAAAVRAGVDWVQVRDRELAGRDLLEHSLRVSRAARSGAAEARREVRIVINRRVDVALAAGADGVHLGFDAMDPARARGLLGPDALVGFSAHAPEEIAVAAAEPAREVAYAHLAPVFPPLSKAATGARAPVGLAGLRTAAAGGLPVLAQGGIDASNARAARDAGAAGVAVTGAILMADDPAAATAALREALDG